MKFGTDVHGRRRMKPTDFGSPLIFEIVEIYVYIYNIDKVEGHSRLTVDELVVKKPGVVHVKHFILR